jgi:uncharacterized membrane protein
MKKPLFSVRDLSLIGVSAALVVLATMFLKIPGPTGMVHFGSAIIFTVASIFGGLYAAAAGAIGALIFDLIGGQMAYTAWSFFIKGISGLVVGMIAVGVFPRRTETLKPGRRYARVLTACLTGTLINAAGYFLAWWQVLGDVRVAAVNIYMYSLPTSVLGIVSALALAPPIQKALEKSGFFNRV